MQSFVLFEYHKCEWGMHRSNTRQENALAGGGAACRLWVVALPGQCIVALGLNRWFGTEVQHHATTTNGVVVHLCKEGIHQIKAGDTSPYTLHDACYDACC